MEDISYNENVISDELMEFILNNVELYLGENTYDKKLIILYINMLCQNIIIQTNRNKFPEALRYLVIDLVKDKFDINKPDSEIQSVQSMSETGRSINFGTSGVLATKLSLIAQKQLEEHTSLINRYRLVYRT